MKIIRIVRVLLLTLIVMPVFSSCSSSSKNKGKEHIAIAEPVAKIEDELFEEFFLKFSDDTTFQKSRILFPLKYSSIDIMDDLEQTLIAESNWKPLNFKEDDQAKNRDIDAYEVLIEETTNKAIYIRKGIDNGILQEYHFENQNSKWFLAEIIDKSN